MAHASTSIGMNSKADIAKSKRLLLDFITALLNVTHSSDGTLVFSKLIKANHSGT